MASITADCISNDAGGGGPQDHDPIAPIVFDNVGLWDSVARLHDADVDGRTAEHQDPMRLVLPNAVLDERAKLFCETSRPLSAAFSIVLPSTIAVAPLLIAIPNCPPVTMRPLTVTSRPRTWIAGWRVSGAWIDALPCPSGVM